MRRRLFSDPNEGWKPEWAVDGFLFGIDTATLGQGTLFKQGLKGIWNVVTGLGKRAKSAWDVWKREQQLLGFASKPKQIHHFLTNKHKTKYAKEFEKILDKYGLNLNGDWNKKLLPHQGRHPNEYHDYMLEQVRRIDEIARGDKNKFLELFEELKEEVSSTPEMLYKDFWRK